MHLNHPETIPLLWSMEKLSSAELVPGAKKVGDRFQRVKASPRPGSVGLRVSPVHGGQSLGASGNVNTPMLTCFQEPECFPSPEPLQSKVFSYIFLFLPEHPFALREFRNAIEGMNTKGFCGVSIYPQTLKYDFQNDDSHLARFLPERKIFLNFFKYKD